MPDRIWWVRHQPRPAAFSAVRSCRSWLQSSSGLFGCDLAWFCVPAQTWCLPYKSRYSDESLLDTLLFFTLMFASTLHNISQALRISSSFGSDALCIMRVGYIAANASFHSCSPRRGNTQYCVVNVPINNVKNMKFVLKIWRQPKS